MSHKILYIWTFKVNNVQRNYVLKVSIHFNCYISCTNFLKHCNSARHLLVVFIIFNKGIKYIWQSKT